MPARFDAIGIVSADIARSAAFYRAIGLDIPEPHGDRHFEVTLPSGVRLMWDSEELITQIDPSWHPPDRHRVALAFACDSPAEVDATYERGLAAEGSANLAPWDAFWGYRYAQLLDPDGQAVDLFAKL